MREGNRRAADIIVTLLSRLGEWTVVDKVLAGVLGANVLLLGVLAILPESDKSPVGDGPVSQAPPEPPVQQPPPPTKEPEPPAKEPEPPPTKEREAPPAKEPEPPRQRAEPAAPEDPDRMPANPRSRLWAEANDLAGRGDLGGAIARLELLLREEHSLGDVVRRAVYTQLAYYCGLADRTEDARRYLRLSRSDLELGFVPDELWRIAEEAYAAGDWATARRYAARFLLTEGQMAEELKRNIPIAYLRLADGYRDEAKGKAREEAKK